MKKLIALTLAMLMLSFCLFSCSKDDEGGNESSVSASDGSQETRSLDKLDAYDFDKRDFTILTREEFAYEMANDDTSASALSQYVFERNTAVEEKYNVKLNVLTELGSWANRASYKEKISTAIYGGDSCEYDLICGAQNQINLYVTEGFFANLNAVETLNFQNDWWFDGFVDNMTLNGKLYFTVGDAGPSLLENMNIIVFNKDLCADNGIELPYEYVRSNKWTLEQMDIMTDKFGYTDDNENDTPDDGDIFSIVGGGAMLRGLSTSFKMDITTRDSNGYPEITLYNARNVEIFEMFQEFLYDGNKGNFRDGSDPHTSFGKNKALMQFATLTDVMNIRQKYSVNYGIVPYPKYDENQEHYYTHIYETLTVFAIPINAESQKESGIILEALGAASYDYVTPKYFETVLQYRNSQDTDSLEMIQMARENISFNFGFVHSGAIGDIGSILDNMKKGDYNLTSSWENRSGNWKLKLSALIDQYLKIEEKQ